WWRPAPCACCKEKDLRLHLLHEIVSRDRLRIAILEERLAKATDLLLAEKGTAPMTAPAKFTAKDADDLMRQSFAFFKDEDDTGDGKIRDMDNLSEANV